MVSILLLPPSENKSFEIYLNCVTLIFGVLAEARIYNYEKKKYL